MRKHSCKCDPKPKKFKRCFKEVKGCVTYTTIIYKPKVKKYHDPFSWCQEIPCKKGHCKRSRCHVCRPHKKKHHW